MPKPNLELSTADSNRLKVLEEIVSKTEHHFIMCGNALMEIRDKKLYRVHYDNFNDYVKAKWFKGRDWAYRMINAAVVVKELPTKLSPMVNNERVARELSAVPEELRAAVVEHISSAHHPVTHTAVKQAHAEVAAAKAEKPKKVLLEDDTGYTIPEHLHEFWKRRSELQQFISQISGIKCAIAKLRVDDPLFAKIDQSVISDLEAAYYCFTSAKLYCVCGTCQGWAEKTSDGICLSCNNTGFMSKVQYDRLLPEEIKAIRDRVIKEKGRK
jgi:hypothetical protein